MPIRSLLVLLAACLAGGPCAGAPEWTPVELEPAPSKELVDLQSPIHAYAHDAAAAPVTIGSERFRFVEGKRGEVTWTREGAAPEDKRKAKGRFRRPALVVLPQAGARGYPVYVPAQGPLVVGSALGLRVPGRSGHGYLVDCDLDGVLGSAEDGYVAPASRTVGPWSGQVWTAEGARAYRKTAEGVWEQRILVPPHPGDQDHVAAWSLLQWRRQQCGCLPLSYDKALEPGMRAHAAYLARYPEEAHSEDPAKDGYSPEGARAAASCIIGHQDESMVSAIQMHLATLYHRTRPLQPGLVKSAMVFEQGSFLFDVFTHRGGPQASALLVYPPHGMQDVPTHFHPEGESPMPIDTDVHHGRWLGTALALFSEPLRVAERLASEPQLVLERRKRGSKRARPPVTGHWHYPGHPPNDRTGISNRGCVALVPDAPLRPRTRYEARLEIDLPDGDRFAYTWSFTTATAVRRKR